MPLPLVTMIGNLAFLDLKVGKSGHPWVVARIACSDRVSDQAGGTTDGPPTYMTFLAFRSLADHVARSCRVGDQVVVVGKIRQRQFEQDGEKRTVYEVVADSVGVSLQYVDARTPRSQPEDDPQAHPADPWKGAYRGE